MTANEVYRDSAGNPNSNGGKKKGTPANVPDDPFFSELMDARTVSYSPLVSRALRRSEASPELVKYHLHAATIFFSNLLYWTPKSRADGWIYKSREEVEKETDLGRRAQDHGRKLLREAGVLEEHLIRGRMYYRVGWGGLKSLLRVVRDESTAADPGTTVGPDPGTTAGPASVGTTQDIQTIQVHSSPSPPAPSRETDLLAGEDDERKTKEVSERSRNDKTLKDKILREVSEIPKEEVSEEATRIGRLVAEALGQNLSRFETRLAEYSIRRGSVELLGELLGRTEGTNVKHPPSYLSACLAAAVKDEEGLLEERVNRPGTPVERFSAARKAESTGDGGGAEGLPSLNGRRKGEKPVYGVGKGDRPSFAEVMRSKDLMKNSVHNKDNAAAGSPREDR